MAHLAGIDKGPVLDWTDDNGLMECFRKWKKRWTFCSKVHSIMPMIQSNTIILFTGLVKLGWKIEGKIHNENRNQIDRYFKLLKNILHPN